MPRVWRMKFFFAIMLWSLGVFASWSPHKATLKEWAPTINQMQAPVNHAKTALPLPTRATESPFSGLFVPRRKLEEIKIAYAHELAMQREEERRLDAIQLANQLNYKPIYVDGWESALIKAVRNTDSGISAPQSLKQEVNRLILRLSLATALRTPIPLEDRRLFGKYEVSYVGAGSSQRGNPAGGKYRSKLGRLLYRNDGLYQHILLDKDQQETIVINYIRGTLISFIPFAVILKGIATSLEPEERINITNKFRQVLSPSTVQADFLPPLIVVGNLASKWPLKGFCFTAGPKSNVILGASCIFLYFHYKL